MIRVCIANDSSEVNACYDFVDAMFTRRLFTLTSWAGGSKSSVKKTPFRNFRRTIELFTSLVRKIHPLFSETSCQDFFKNKVISNSTKRAEKPPTRASRTKTRKKRNFTQTNDDISSIEDYVDDEDDGHEDDNNLIHSQFKQDDGDIEVSVRKIMKTFRYFLF